MQHVVILQQNGFCVLSSHILYSLIIIADALTCKQHLNPMAAPFLVYWPIFIYCLQGLPTEQSKQLLSNTQQPQRPRQS